MLQELKNLLQLQELDQEIAKLRSELQRFEPVITGLERERARRVAAQTQRRNEAASSISMRKKLEGELKEAESKLARFRQQQQQVRTAKEAEALQHEADACASQAAALEDRILQLMEKEEQAGRDALQSETKDSASETEVASELKRLRALKDEKAALIRTLQLDQERALGLLSEDLRDTYVWLLRKHGPTAVAGVDNGACGGCGNLLVAQMAVQASSGQYLLQCPNCQRFLRP